MIPRYSDPRIAEIFTDQAKLNGWQWVELSVVQARSNLGLIPSSTYFEMANILYNVSFDIDFWLAEDKRIHHDLNAFIAERVRHLPPELAHEFHKDMTSYDTEDPAFARALLDAASVIRLELEDLTRLLGEMARQYRYVVMLRRTHGQWAKLGSFGGRVLTWIAMLNSAMSSLDSDIEQCKKSRISGAIGNYGGNMTPLIEARALRLVGLEPFYGATQIMPRTVHARLAQTLQLIAEAIGKIALDIRLGARSGKPLWHEPFSKVQKGSSAMPHKKNTINTEKICGMVNLVRGNVMSIVQSIQTWEERAIEQSCVERVAWPDLFHTMAHMTTVLTKVLQGLVVYPDHMMQEIVESRGTYASDEAKNFLATECASRGVGSETAYRIIQLSSFCVFEPTPLGNWARNESFTNHEQADEFLSSALRPITNDGTIKNMIGRAQLFPVEGLAATVENVDAWNALLRDIFSDEATQGRWEHLFKPSNLLKGEAFLFEQILDHS
ncbi:hypothetical protein HZC00_04905 [Candidatus Kaiserbacteria bacterium]|nr:hypothetical protein [Candidatus Kaiserbacteria bacterium]